MRYVIFIALLLGLGCGGGSQGPPVQPVSGLVTVSGKPAAGVMVRLHARGAGADDPTDAALTGPDGRFTLQYSGRPGAPEVVHAVTLTWPPPMGLGPPGQAKTDRFGGRYADPARPFTEVTIQPGTTELSPFDVPDKLTPPKIKLKVRNPRP